MSEFGQTPQPNPAAIVPNLPIPPAVGAVLSIVPGLGQLLTGHVWRGILLFSSIVSIFGLSLWRLDEAGIGLELLPPNIDTTSVYQYATRTTDIGASFSLASTDEIACASPIEQPSSQDDAPTIAVAPDCGIGSQLNDDFSRSPGTTVTLTGTNFSANETVDVVIRTSDGAEVLPRTGAVAVTATADENGDFTTSFDIPTVTLPDGTAEPAIIDILARRTQRVVLSETTSRPQVDALWYAGIAMFFGTIAYIWNIFDGYACAKGKGSPPRLGMVFILLGTLTIGGHITEINIGKAIREIDDIGPRLSQILWPWNPDKILTYDTKDTEGVATFLASTSAGIACAADPAEQPSVEAGEPYLVISTACGQPAGQTSPSGMRAEGTSVTVQGYDFTPNETAVLVIKPESVPAFRPRVNAEIITVTPDDNGEFEFEFEMPNFTIPAEATRPIEVEIILRQTQEVGSPYLVEEFWLALEGIVITIFLALMATAAGLILAVPMSFLAARNLMSANSVTLTIYYVVRLIMNVVRSIEPIIWALIAIIWVGPGPFAGVIALTVHTIASLGKLYSESIEGIDNGPIEAIRATGANSLQTIMYAVVPQVIPPFVSFTIYRWDINVRMSTIIGAVGGGGIGVVLIQWIRLADYDSVGIAVWMIAIVVTILDYASSQIREAYT